jgi:hypothetical protein
MKNIYLLLFTVITAVILASLYGIVHDQITYGISSEYYTKFKFYQFGLIESPNAFVSNPREMAVIVGVMATWWMGLLIGLLLYIAAFNIRPAGYNISVIVKAMLLTILVTFLVGLSGLVYGLLFLSGQTKENLKYLELPENLENIDRYLMVGTMHNFSYMGGTMGLIAAILYIKKRKRSLNVLQNKSKIRYANIALLCCSTAVDRRYYRSA